MCLHNACSHTMHTSTAPPHRLEYLRVMIAVSNNHLPESEGVHFPAAAWQEATLKPEPSTQCEQRPKTQVNGLKLMAASPVREGEGSHPVLQLRALELSSMCWLKTATKKAAGCPACFSLGIHELLGRGVRMCLE